MADAGKEFAVPGWYGKLPALGDFAHRSLDPAIVEALDNWLGQRLHESQHQLGPVWADRYWSMPLWRFVIPKSLSGIDTHIGVMVPSADKVGRTFPLVAALPLGVDLINAALLESCDVWFDAVESVLVDVINGGHAGPDQLDEMLQTCLPRVQRVGGSAVAAADSDPPDLLFELALPDDGNPVAQWDESCQQSLLQHPDFTLWWCTSSGHPSRLLVCGGWPSLQQFCRLMNAEDGSKSWVGTETGHFDSMLDDLLGSDTGSVEAEDTQPRIAAYASAVTVDPAEITGPQSAAVDSDTTQPGLMITTGAFPEPPRAHQRSFGLSDVGCHRENNQDSILVREQHGLWIVADGMGGHSAGELASQTICERLGALTLNQAPLANADAIESELEDIDHWLLQRAKAEGSDIIGSTVVLALETARHWLVAWAGDSRTYGLIDQSMVQLTRDHCQYDMGFEAGLDWEDIRDHPVYDNPGLARAIGAGRPRIDWRLVRKAQCARLLLCSDGLYGAVPAGDIAREFSNVGQGAETTVRNLVERAKANNCQDNVSVIVIDR